MTIRNRLRIAAQKSGRLADPCRELFTRIGLQFNQGQDRLFCTGTTEPIDLLLVRDDDIPDLIADGTCDFGVVGRNVLRERQLRDGNSNFNVEEIFALGFGQCRLSIAVPQEFNWSGPLDLTGLRIATSYPLILADWLQTQGINAEIVTLSGSVEIATKLGKADAICDLVSSGATLQANQLREVQTVLQSEAVLVASRQTINDDSNELSGRILRRLQGVLQQRDSRLVMLQVDRSALERVMNLLPQKFSTSVTTIDGLAQRVNVQAVCQGSLSWQQLEAMQRAGASGLLVLPVERMLA